jgi:hypothetical protein
MSKASANYTNRYGQLKKMKNTLIIIFFSSIIFFGCDVPYSNLKSKESDSVNFFLTDSTTKEFWFNEFRLKLFKDSTYNFDFKFWGSYQAKEKGHYFIKGDSLKLIPAIGGFDRTLIFKPNLKESDFYSKSNFLKTNFLKAHNLNIDLNENNPAKSP